MEGVELSLNKARDSFTVVNPPSALDLLPQTARSPSLQTRSDTSPTDVEEPSSHVSSSTPSNQPSTDPLLQEPLPTQVRSMGETNEQQGLTTETLKNPQTTPFNFPHDIIASPPLEHSSSCK